MGKRPLWQILADQASPLELGARRAAKVPERYVAQPKEDVCYICDGCGADLTVRAPNPSSKTKFIIRRATAWTCTAPGCDNICCMECCEIVHSVSITNQPARFLCRGPKLIEKEEQCYQGIHVFHQQQNSGNLIHGGERNVAKGNRIKHSFGPGRHQAYVCEMGQLIGSKEVHHRLMVADAFSPVSGDARRKTQSGPVSVDARTLSDQSGASRVYTIARKSAATQLEIIVAPHFIAVLSRFSISPNDLDDGKMRVMPRSIVDYMNENDDAFLRMVEVSLRYEIVLFDYKMKIFRGGRLMEKIADDHFHHAAPSWADFLVYAYQYLLEKNGIGKWPLPALSLPWCLYGFEERLVIATRSTGRAAGRSRVGGLRSSTACALLRSVRLEKYYLSDEVLDLKRKLKANVLSTSRVAVQLLTGFKDEPPSPWFELGSEDTSLSICAHVSSDSSMARWFRNMLIFLGYSPEQAELKLSSSIEIFLDHPWTNVLLGCAWRVRYLEDALDPSKATEFTYIECERTWAGHADALLFESVFPPRRNARRGDAPRKRQRTKK